MKKQIVVNKAYLPYLKSTQKIQIFYGGSSSGKSFFLAQRVIMDVLQGRNYLIVRNVGATIRYSVYNQLCKTIIAMGVQHLFKFTGSNFAITCMLNGRQILFSGLDDVEKLKSVTPQVGILTDVWIEEATETKYEDYKQLTKRLRGIEGEDVAPVPKRITFSFNPVMQTHWIYKEFFGVWDDSKTKYEDDDMLIVKTTYKDNSFLAPDDIKSLENEKDKYFYEVYTLGNWGILGKVIFRNWKVEDLTDRIPHFDKIYNGLDFGFSEDPNAFIKCHVDQARMKIYVYDELYRSGMLNDELARELKPRLNGQYVTCDSGEPKSIEELNRNGIRALGARKGRDSVNYGIDFLSRYEIIIDINCQNFKNEISTYHWQEDKYGNALRKPVDKDNHLMDALRYATEELQSGSSASATYRM